MLWFLSFDSHQVIDRCSLITLFLTNHRLPSDHIAFWRNIIARSIFEMNHCPTVEQFVVRPFTFTGRDARSHLQYICMYLSLTRANESGTLVHARATSPLTERPGCLPFAVGDRDPRACLTTGPAHRILPRPQTRYGPG